MEDQPVYDHVYTGYDRYFHLTAPQVVAVLFFKLLEDVTTSIGYSKKDGFYKSQGLLIGWVSQLCDGTLIWGRPYILTMVAIVAGLGFGNFTAATYFKFAGLYLLFAVVVAILMVKLWMRPDVSKFKSFDDAAMREELKKNPNQQGEEKSLWPVWQSSCCATSWLPWNSWDRLLLTSAALRLQHL